MKIEFIKRGAATRLILLFAGWSTDARFYSDCTVDGWDTAVLSDYRDLTMPELPRQYSTVYVFAYSLGVWAASRCNLNAAARIAVCGSGIPVSDAYGIPVAVYKATADGLTAESLKKFHRRMAGDRATLQRIGPLLPLSPDIAALKEELLAIADGQVKTESGFKWDKAYIAAQDRIFPTENLDRYWNSHPEAVKVMLNSSHAVDMPQIIKDVIPNLAAIEEGFSSAADTYNGNALVQEEICHRMGEIISVLVAEKNPSIHSLLEIGAGQGLLTETWRRILSPSTATFIDLIPMPDFGATDSDEYVVADAEEWLRNSSTKYDVILSASTIQWFADPVGFIRTVKEHLNPGGFAVISTFIKGNLHELDAIRPCPLIYRTAEEYKEIPGIQAEVWVRKLQFSSSREMLMHLRLTGVTSGRERSKNMKKKEENPKPKKVFSEFPSVLTYRPIILCMVL